MNTAVRRFAPAAVALAAAGALVAWELQPQPAAPTQVVAQAPDQRTVDLYADTAHPLMGDPIPAGQQRFVAGEPATLADGSTVTVHGPAVGVPAGSAATIGADTPIPVTFRIDVVAGDHPISVAPTDFVVTLPAGTKIVGAVTSAAGALTAVTVPAHGTLERTLSLTMAPETSQIAYAPGGVTQVAWVFTPEDD